MTLDAVIGAAGVGKTHSLMAALAEKIATRPLQEGERVLALTFMHGSRRRLDSRLAALPGLRNRYQCTTIDLFAWQLCTRWRSLMAALGIAELRENQYEATCDAAGTLLERPEVCAWVVRSFPIIVLDEAQDLGPERLRMIRALEPRVALFSAADEFQCLDTKLRPNPATLWMSGIAVPRILDAPRRTQVPGLLAAARAIRAGEAVQSAGQEFVLIAAPGRPPFTFAATCVSNGIAWNGGREIAIITPSKAGGFSAAVLDRVRSGPAGTQQNGPYTIPWELSDSERLEAIVAGLRLPADGNAEALLGVLDAVPHDPVLRRCGEWIRRQRSLGAMSEFPPVLVRERIEISLAQHRRQSRGTGTRLKAMTVHQAKNREFEGVIVLWPYRIAGGAEQQRRLLYNAVTRAQRWCTVIVQAAAILAKPPFAA